MASNCIFAWSKSLELTCSSPATPASGDPVVCGQIAGVALDDENAGGTTVVALDGVFDLSVGGVDGGGNSAVAVGDILYYSSGDTPKVNKKTAGVRLGYALEAVDSAGTATVRVLIGK